MDIEYEKKGGRKKKQEHKTKSMSLWQGRMTAADKNRMILVDCWADVLIFMIRIKPTLLLWYDSLYPVKGENREARLETNADINTTTAHDFVWQLNARRLAFHAYVKRALNTFAHWAIFIKAGKKTPQMDLLCVYRGSYLQCYYSPVSGFSELILLSLALAFHWN